MDEVTKAYVLLGILALISSLIWHFSVKQYLLASIAAALTAGITFQVIGYIKLGYLESFFIISLAVTTAASFFMSLLIGLPFKVRRGALSK